MRHALCPMLRALLLALPLGLLAACGPRPASDLPDPPEALLTPCRAPQSWVPGRALAQAQVETLWGRDRDALRACGAQLRLLGEWAQGMAGAGR
ncbi:hypothetical protein [Alkalilacustris brevis]|uniref:hypothetical protein n=1 Tax=Alkalilacustris brevis TaxID=2026338 RepID=UPI0012D2DA72|nr:hypothetical protein [Alkalilacustris brevis]